MSDQPGAWRAEPGVGSGAPSSPPTATQARRTVATFSTYREAERAVDRLSDRGFPVQRVAVVGRDLQLVEEVADEATRLLA